MRIEAGKYYRTRDGRKVGPMVAHVYLPRFCAKEPDGRFAHWDINGTALDYYAPNLVAEWDGDPLPYGHARLPDGSVVDLCDNREAHGLMSPDKRAAMEAHGGPYERFNAPNFWCKLKDKPHHWFADHIYRVAPKPREGWVPVLHPSARDCKIVHPGCEPVFVRVVEGGAA
jgi:hypothetical protein